MQILVVEVEQRVAAVEYGQDLSRQFSDEIPGVCKADLAQEARWASISRRGPLASHRSIRKATNLCDLTAGGLACGHDEDIGGHCTGLRRTADQLPSQLLVDRDVDRARDDLAFRHHCLNVPRYLGRIGVVTWQLLLSSCHAVARFLSES